MIWGRLLSCRGRCYMVGTLLTTRCELRAVGGTANCSGSSVRHKLPKGIIGADESSASTAGHLAPNAEPICCTSSHALAANSRWSLRCALTFLMGLPLLFTSDDMTVMYAGLVPKTSAARSRRDRGMLSISSVPSRTSSRPPGRGMAHPSLSRSAPKGTSTASRSALLTLCEEYSIHAMYWHDTQEGARSHRVARG